MKKVFLSMALMALAGTAWADDLAIRSVEDWDAFCSSPDMYASGSITLDADICIGKGFPGTFTGTFDGQGHTVTLDGLQATEPFALFNTTGEGASIRNMGVAGSITSTKSVGIITLNANGTTTIDNVKVSADITSSGYPLSGFVVSSKAWVRMSDCLYSGHIQSKANASVDISGFISTMSGESAFKMDRCAFTGGIEVISGWRAGAFVSSNTSTLVADCEMNFCEMSGSIEQKNGSERVGGFIGSPNTNSSSYIMNGCLMNGTCKRWNSNSDPTFITQENCIILGCGTWKNMGGNTSMTNCYMTPATEMTAQNMNGFFMVDAAQVKSGALCYNLNGDQSSIGFYQTLESDDAPTLDKTHKQVFCSGRKHCDGTDYEGVTYNNVSGEIIQDSHDYQDGACSYCGAPEEADGYLLIKSQKAWDGFVARHNTGSTTLNVRLFCDVEQDTPLADGYSGTLDGQGHSITLHMGDETGRYSLFSTIGAATIRNVILDGELTGESNTAPIACRSEQPLLIENVVSKVKITQTTLNDGNCAGMVGLINGNSTIFRNCISAATVSATKDAGGFVGWAPAEKNIRLENCAMIGEVTVNSGASAVFLRVRNDCNVSLTNCYYVPCTPSILAGNGNNMPVTATETDRADVGSGALCYMLNGDQSNIALYQTIGSDEMPVPDHTHGQVYANGHKHCDGTDYDGMVYSNEKGSTSIDNHDFDNGVCNYCGQLQMNEDGIFEINDERTLAAFAKAVNNGQNTISAIMSEDVVASMGDKDSDSPMIGISLPYSGTFDGQGHTLNITVDGGGTDSGIFATVGNATIKNLTAEGSVRNAAQAGFIGDLTGSQCTLENIVVKMDIEGTTNVAGFIGICNNNSGTCDMRNLMFAGKVTYAGVADKNGIGGFCGWSPNGKFNMSNCIMVGEIDLGSGTFPALMLRVPTSCSIKSSNCAYVPVEGVTYVNGYNSEMDNSPVACENATDGAVCYAANGNSFQSPVWYQTLNEDDQPTLDASHNVVYPSTEGFFSRSKDDYEEIANDLIAEASEYANLEEHPAQKALADDYKEAISELASATSFDELVNAYYPTISEKRDAVAKSIVAYARLAAKVAETSKYIEDHTDDFKGGPAYQKLESYLSEDIIDPDEEEFPNGSYAYIMDIENMQLDEAGIETEIAFISKMLEDALNEGLNPGADATSFIVNADFSDGFNGWEGTKMTNTAKGETNGLGVAESWSKNAFDMHQTIKLPENGIYALTLGGAYRINKKGDSRMHGAMAYMNNNQTFLQSTIEGIISSDEAVDRGNCWTTGSVPDYAIKNSSDEIVGYTVHGVQGAACAFGAGRYTNRLLVNVTDSTLTLGVRNAHSIYSGNEWVGIGNLRLTYCGTLDEAGEALDATLANMCDRARNIIENEADEDDSSVYPNFAKVQRDALRELVEKVATLTTAQEKYDMVGTLGEAFEQIYECQKNYSGLVTMADAMASACGTLQNAGTINEEEASEAFNLIRKTQEGYTDGTYSSKEAAEGGDMKKISFYPTINADGILEIGDAKTLNVFAAMTSAGMSSLNATLMSDITTDDGFTMIGGNLAGADHKYNGTFDGQGHTLTVNIELPEHNMTGVFGHTGDAVIRNVKFTGTIIGNDNTGLVGNVQGKTRFENVESNLNITGGNNVGGFAGIATSGPQHFTNCLFSGKVTTTTNGGGGFYGWSSDNSVYADNCLSIGEVVGEQCAYFFRVKCNGTIGMAGDAGCYVYGGNMYFLRTSDPSVLVSGTPLWWGEFLTDVILEVSADELASGKVCYTLNAGNTETPAWRQTLKSDSTPLLNSDHLKVLYSDEKGYYNELTDAITQVEPGCKQSSGISFDLTGRKVQRPQRGIYIINGRKVVVK